MMKNFTLLTIILFCFSNQLFAQKTSSFIGDKVVLNDEKTIQLNEKFKKYDVYKISSENMNIFLEISDLQSEIQLQLGDKYNWNLELMAYDIFSEDNLRQIYTEDGIEKLDKVEVKTYKGKLEGIEEVRLTIQDGLITGMIEDFGVQYFIEPVNKYDLNANDNEYVVYKTSDVLNQQSHTCGFNEVREKGDSFNENPYDVYRLDTQSGGSPCRKVEVAQAYDNGIINRYGSNANVSTWNAAIWNVVNGFYVSTISYTIEFEIIAESFNPPFATSTDINTYLVNFRDWGNGGGFGTTDYDLGNLWTTIDVQSGGNTSVIGSVMDIGGVCTNNRYQIFEDFIGPTTVPPTGGALNILAVLIAHEAGHNLGMWHNDPAGANIMEPGLNQNASTFSETSKHYLRSRLEQLTCLSTCYCVEVVQAVPVNCSADGSTFDMQLTVEHDNTAGTFTASAGGITASQAYGANPQTVILSGVPSGTTSITVTDDGDGSCSHTSIMQLPDNQGVSAINKLTYCESDVAVAPTQNLTANYEENYGSITVTVNSDGDPTNGLYGAFEQSLQIIDVNGNVVGDIPIQSGSFNTNPTVLTVTDLNLNAEFAPYTVIIGDQYGDGLVAADCFGGTIFNGGYIIADGQGNTIFNGTLQDDGNCGDGNNAVSASTTFTPAIDYTTAGNFSGPGITDATADDGAAVFDPSGLAVGQHLINYEMDTYEGCIAEQQVVNVYAEPVITLNNTACNGSTSYNAVVNVDLGTWNSILSGDDTNYTVSTTAGTLASATINANGTFTINNIPAGTNITVTIGNGTTENGTCNNTFMVMAPSCAAEYCNNICYVEYNANPGVGDTPNATLCVTPLGCADSPDASCLTTQACNDNNICTNSDEETIVTLTNEVCIACAGTVDPTSCDAACVTVQACDDGNPCTINDEETVSADGGVCVPCAGIVDPTSCDAACVTVQACDDGNPCTINDEETVSADGGICVACAGIVDPTSCDAACVTVQACDDGNPCTINDEETISADGGICVACAGVVDPTSCDAACVTVQACDDGNPCTINDEETVSADGGICVACAGVVDPTSCDAACVTVQACDDGNPCTINDEETVSADGGICVACAGVVDPTSCDAACVTVQACDDGNPCTINDEETVSADGGICVACAGVVGPTSCDAACVTVQACDDGDPCTSGEMETLAADGGICVPCGGGVPVTPACGDPNATNYDMNAICIDNSLCTYGEYCDLICFAEYTANPNPGDIANSTLCITPVSCNGDASCLVTQGCDDGNPCTIGDEETVAPDGSICVACAGTVDLTSCDAACVTVQPCDDGNPCTINDEETVSADGGICVPCAGIVDPTSCDAACVTVQPCDDGNPCTINDEETVSADGGICVACAGIVDSTSCDAACVTVQACDDGNPCTINDEETVSADGGICVACAGVVDPTSCDAGCTTMQACDDGDPCTSGEMETLAADGGICVPCGGGVPVTPACGDPNATNYDMNATCIDNSLCTYGEYCDLICFAEYTANPNPGDIANSTLCITPVSCNGDASCLVTQACDDGDPCTINDEETVAPDGSVCVPCTGIVDATSCDAACVTTQACDDGDPCTTGETEGLSADGDICVPCGGGVPVTPACGDPNATNYDMNATCIDNSLCTYGEYCDLICFAEYTANPNPGDIANSTLCITPVSCNGDASCLVTQACDDGDPCTINDEETVAPDGSVCVPCTGIVDATSCDAACVTTQACDDGDPCTTGETEGLSADGNICVPCGGGTLVAAACGDPNATNYDMNATCIDNSLCTYDVPTIATDIQGTDPCFCGNPLNNDTDLDENDQFVDGNIDGITGLFHETISLDVTGFATITSVEITSGSGVLGFDGTDYSTSLPFTVPTVVTNGVVATITGSTDIDIEFYHLTDDPANGITNGFMNVVITVTGTDAAGNIVSETSEAFTGSCSPCPFNADIPTLSEWGLITLTLMLMTYGSLAMAGLGSLAGTNNVNTPIGLQLPINVAILRKAFVLTAVLALLGYTMSIVFFGAIFFSDIVGVAIAGPVFAYLIHVLYLIEKNK